MKRAATYCNTKTFDKRVHTRYNQEDKLESKRTDLKG